MLWKLNRSSQPVLILFLRAKDISHCQIHAYQTSSVPKEPKLIKKKKNYFRPNFLQQSMSSCYNFHIVNNTAVSGDELHPCHPAYEKRCRSVVGGLITLYAIIHKISHYSWPGWGNNWVSLTMQVACTFSNNISRSACIVERSLFPQV